MKRAWVLCVAAAGILSVTLGCSEKIEPGHSTLPSGPPVQAAIAAAQIGPWPLIFEAVGTVKAETASTVSAKLMGTVTSVAVKEGDRVRRGGVLLTIDERQVSAQRQQAEAAFAEARQAEQAAGAARKAAAAGAELAAATYQRYRMMLDQESVGRQEFEEVDARFRQARAALAQSEDMQKAAGQRVRQAEAALAAARVSAADAVLTAAFDGIVTAKMVDPGDLAVPGKPLLRLEKAGGPGWTYDCRRHTCARCGPARRFRSASQARRPLRWRGSSTSWRRRPIPTAARFSCRFAGRPAGTCVPGCSRGWG